MQGISAFITNANNELSALKVDPAVEEQSQLKSALDAVSIPNVDFSTIPMVGPLIGALMHPITKWEFGEQLETTITSVLGSSFSSYLNLIINRDANGNLKNASARLDDVFGLHLSDYINEE